MIIEKGKEFVFKDTGEVIQGDFQDLVYSDYIKQGVKYVLPMTAYHYRNKEELDKMLNSSKYFAEEKFDGVRATLHVGESFNRVFSRRVSKVSGWFAENTDSLPQLKYFPSNHLDGTVLDGELKMLKREFKDVSSTMNCKWDKAIRYQLDMDFITLVAFDIVYYRGVYIAKMPLHRRKHYLKKVVGELNNPYIVESRYTTDSIDLEVTKEMVDSFTEEDEEIFPNLYKTFDNVKDVFKMCGGDTCPIMVDKTTWYEFVVYNGGEGLMLKDRLGKYYHKKCREYTKHKKFRTWDCVIMGFRQPTKEYNGKELKKANGVWDYWESPKNNHILLEKFNIEQALERELIPVSKLYALSLVGNLVFGVYREYSPKDFSKKYGKERIEEPLDDDGNVLVLEEIGECSGLTEKQRSYFTKHEQEVLGKTVEIKGQEILDKKKGSIRHPDYLRLRPDKDPLDCTFHNHLL